MPKFWPVWWDTGREKVDGYYPARVLKSYPYTGRYPEFFNYVLVLEAPRTRSGELEMAVKL